MINWARLYIDSDAVDRPRSDAETCESARTLTSLARYGPGMFA
jgi:hypothetical protein